MADLNDPSIAWWRNAVVYQIYVRSFADSDGDGIGDLPGITARLPHLADLGVDALWITPFYTSPQHDHGYDVADYRDVDPLFGQLSDADDLIARAHELGLRVIVDLVPNHTSDEHEWFQAALAAGPGSPERARYLFRDSEDGNPPNNWQSVFGGPAWTQVEDGQWYLHLFDSTQPDLDWRNPEVPEMFEGVLRFWLDRGVDGFRVDVAHGLFKEASLRDQVVEDGGRARERRPTRWSSARSRDEPMWDQPEVHERLPLVARRSSTSTAPTGWPSPRRGPRPWSRWRAFVRPDELDQTFNFAWLLAEWSAEAFAEVITDTLASVAPVGASPTWVLSNHDVDPPRHPLRRRRPGPGPRPRGDADHARAARLELPLPGRGARPRAGRRRAGVPAGPVVPPHRRGRPRRLPGADPVERHGGAVRLRARRRPAVDPAAGGLGAAHRRGADRRPDVDAGVLPRRAARAPRLRVDRGRLGRGRRTRTTTSSRFRRGPITVVLNCGDAPVELPEGEVLMASGPVEGGKLAPDTAAWLR